jgi:hypothetical protein
MKATTVIQNLEKKSEIREVTSVLERIIPTDDLNRILGRSRSGWYGDISPS